MRFSSKKVSVITVVYNGERYLEQTIQSVINQTYENIEYIIIDGGSTDNTLDIVSRYLDYISYFISEPDNGLYDAMNKGIRIASGDLIGMINSDDWYEPNAVELMVDAYENNLDKTIFHADCYDVSCDGVRKLRNFHPSELKLKYYSMTYIHPSMFVSKHEYSKHVYDVNLKVFSDYKFILESYLSDKKKFIMFIRLLLTLGWVASVLNSPFLTL
ncbi:glycosyltransferase family 2 protein [Microbulbifer taiwanensis]|uniref:glycosyltransferase family 2 protein n=1 Tax=Microbulbifer taiwanensis TaxID=986746 RepID=UPI003613C8AF